MKWLLCLVVLLLASGSVARGGMVAPSEVNPGPAYYAEPGDPLWRPTLEQFQKWVTEGIQAVEQDTPLWEMGAVKDNTWVDADGIPCDIGELVCVTFVNPRLGATVMGYRAAGDPIQWDRIAKDRKGAILDLAKRLENEFSRIGLRFTCLIAGEKPAQHDLRPMVWCQNDWWYCGVAGAGSASGSPEPPPGWSTIQADVVNLLIERGMEEDALFDFDGIWQLDIDWPRSSRWGPPSELVAAVPRPKDRSIRIVVGTPDEYAFVDF
jgi:hypothetical protein